jgi:membrane fusion protein (multidrug efflux system)
VEQRVLATANTLGDQWLVKSGLAAGDRVIIDGLQKVRPGAPAQVAPAADRTAAGPAATPGATPAATAAATTRAAQ